MYRLRDDLEKKEEDELVLLPEICHVCGATLEKKVKEIIIFGQEPIKMFTPLCPNGCQN